MITTTAHTHLRTKVYHSQIILISLGNVHMGMHVSLSVAGRIILTGQIAIGHSILIRRYLGRFAMSSSLKAGSTAKSKQNRGQLNTMADL